MQWSCCGAVLRFKKTVLFGHGSAYRSGSHKITVSDILSSIQSGKNLTGSTFSAWHKYWERDVIQPFGQFVNECFRKYSFVIGNL